MANKNTQTIAISITMLSLLWSCSTNDWQKNQADRHIATVMQTSPALLDFPELTKDKGELAAALKTALKKSVKGMNETDVNEVSERLRKYMSFLGLTAKDFKKAEAATVVVTPDGEMVPADSSKKAPRDVEGGDDEDDKTPSNLKAIQRLLISSTQFLECSRLTDWECLEKEPKLKPRADFRIPKKSDLGVPVAAGDSLDMDVFFTQAWDGSPSGHVVDRFAERLNNDVGKSLSIAMYGIDDVEGSMKGVYDAIVEHAKKSDTQVRAVVDVSGFERGKSPWVFNYLKPQSEELTSSWLFGESSVNPGGMHATFQYEATPDFIRFMNDGIKTQEESRVRLEWSTSHIMHNKYAVMENNDGIKSVWTGTANISNHCMGTEANSNMSVYIRNDHIAQAFLDEFNLMFDFDPTLTVKSKLVRNSDEKSPAMAGRFHRNKYPVSKRFFKFNDGTNVRVHFAPTDDAEHRVILPMLLSAKEGDEIRISMFGGTGYEIVRAMQFAVAKGANIKIVYDSKLGHGLTSWTRDRVLNVFMDNPYIGKILNAPKKAGSISVRISTWKGKNHYKAGTITRRLDNGTLRAEQIIVGSQNWSSGGNDYNDENLVSIQNTDKDVEAAVLFNKEFDTRLWVKSRDERPRLFN